MSRRTKGADELLDVFPERPNQKIADIRDIQKNEKRATRSTNNGSLFTFCTYANKLVAYNTPTPRSKKRPSYSPEPIVRHTPPIHSDDNATPAKKRAKTPKAAVTPQRARSMSVKPAQRARSQSTKPVVRRAKTPAANKVAPNAVPALLTAALALSKGDAAPPIVSPILTPKTRKTSNANVSKPVSVFPSSPQSSSSTNNHSITSSTAPISPKTVKPSMADITVLSNTSPMKLSDDSVEKVASPVVSLPATLNSPATPNVAPKKLTGETNRKRVAFAPNLNVSSSGKPSTPVSITKSSESSSSGKPSTPTSIPKTSGSRPESWKKAKQSATPPESTSSTSKATPSKTKKTSSVVQNPPPAKSAYNIIKMVVSESKDNTPVKEDVPAKRMKNDPDVEIIGTKLASVPQPVASPVAAPQPEEEEVKSIRRTVKPKKRERKPSPPPAYALPLKTMRMAKKRKPIASNGKIVNVVTLDPSGQPQRAKVTRQRAAEQKGPRGAQRVMINPVTSSSHDSSILDVPYEPVYARDDATVREHIRMKKEAKVLLKEMEEAKKAKKPVLSEKQIEGMYKNCHPVVIFGKIAIEYEHTNLSSSCHLVKNLACFHEKHEEILLSAMKLADCEDIKNLNESNIEEFYKEELIPAIDNLIMFKKSPEMFYDLNFGKYERYLEDGKIIEHPMPSRPEVFPSQIRKRELLYDEQLQNEENDRIEAERAQRAYHEQAYQQQMQFHYQQQQMQYQMLEQLYQQQMQPNFVYPLFHDPNNQPAYYPQFGYPYNAGTSRFWHENPHNHYHQ